MPVAREIAEIFANQINYRQSIKDKIETYIMDTELSALDPQMSKLKQAEIKRYLDSIKEIDDSIGQIKKGIINSIGDAANSWAKAQGTIITAEVSQAGKIETAATKGRADVRAANARALADFRIEQQRGLNQQAENEWRHKLASLEELANEEEKGDAGQEDILKKVGDSTTAASAGGFKNEMQRIWEQYYLPKYSALQGNVLGQRRLLDNYKAQVNSLLDNSQVPNDQRGFITSDFIQFLSDTTGKLVSKSTFIQDPIQLQKQELQRMGVKEDVAVKLLSPPPGASEAGLGGTPPVAREQQPMPKYQALGLDNEEALKSFEEKAAFNRYLVETAGTQDATGKVITADEITFDEFMRKASIPGSKEANMITMAKTSAPNELAFYGDSSITDMLLRRKGVEAKLKAAEDAYSSAGSKFPSYSEIQRKTLESYSELYGGKGQQRLVQLAEFGRRNTFEIPQFKDKKTGKVIQMDNPEWEALFEKWQEAQGPEAATPVGPVSPVSPEGPEAAAAGGAVTGAGGGGFRTAGRSRTGGAFDRFLVNPEEGSAPSVVTPGVTSTPTAKTPEAAAELSGYEVTTTNVQLDVPEWEALFGGMGKKIKPIPVTPAPTPPPTPPPPTPVPPPVIASTATPGVPVTEVGVEPPEARYWRKLSDKWTPPPVEFADRLESAGIISVPGTVTAYETTPRISTAAGERATKEAIGASIGDKASKKELEKVARAAKALAPTTPIQPPTDEERDALLKVPEVNEPAKSTELPEPTEPPQAMKDYEAMDDAALEKELKAAVAEADALKSEWAKSEPRRQAQIERRLQELSSISRKIIAASKSNDITEKDFENLTEEELIAKASKPAKRNLSAERLRQNAELTSIAAGSVAASKAQERASAGKQVSPAKFIKGADKLSEGQVATIKNLAQKPGILKAGEIAKTLASVLGEDINSPKVEKAKSLYFAFSQLLPS